MDEDLKDAYLHLIGELIRQALQERGPEWVFTKDGGYWCRLCGLSPQLVHDGWIKRYPPIEIPLVV